MKDGTKITTHPSQFGKLYRITPKEHWHASIEVFVHYSNPSLGDNFDVTINWSATGNQPVEHSQYFANALMHALRISRKEQKNPR